MKISKLTLCCVIAGFAGFSCAMAKNCEPGTYEVSGICYKCDPGCYCTGSSGDNTNFWWWGGNNCVSPGPDFYEKLEKYPNAGVHLCPENYRYSDKGAKSIEECYNRQTKEKYQSPKDKVSNNAASKLKEDASSKLKGTPVTNFGGLAKPETNTTTTPQPQKCQDGYILDSETDKCVLEIVVPAGQYLPKDTEKPHTCDKKQYYCPGGRFTKKDVDQGRFECPYASVPLPDNRGCSWTLSKDQLKYGMSGKPNKTDAAAHDDGTDLCWKYSDTTEYTKCIFGTTK